MKPARTICYEVGADNGSLLLVYGEAPLKNCPALPFVTGWL